MAKNAIIEKFQWDILGDFQFFKKMNFCAKNGHNFNYGAKFSFLWFFKCLNTRAKFALLYFWINLTLEGVKSLKFIMKLQLTYLKNTLLKVKLSGK